MTTGSAFDPFGEPVSDPGSHHSLTRSSIVRRAIVFGFWGLIAGIVLLRNLYFDPDFDFQFGTVASLSKVDWLFL